MENNFKNIIFTDHSLERMRGRNISQHAVWQTLQNPDWSHPEDKPNTARFVRTIAGRKYHVIATHLADQQKSLVISSWVRGEDDPLPLSWKLITLPFKLAGKLATWVFNRVKPSKNGKF